MQYLLEEKIGDLGLHDSLWETAPHRFAGMKSLVKTCSMRGGLS